MKFLYTNSDNYLYSVISIKYLNYCKRPLLYALNNFDSLLVASWLNKQELQV